MRILVALGISLISAAPALAQTAGGTGGSTSTGVPTSVVAPPAENLVPRNQGRIVAPPAENLSPGTAGNIVAPPAENLVPGAPGGAPAATGIDTGIGTGPGADAFTGGIRGGTGTPTGGFSVGPNNTPGLSGLTLPPALTPQPQFTTPQTTFFGGTLQQQLRLQRLQQQTLAGGAGFGVSAGGWGLLAPTGTSPGSRPGNPDVVVAPLDPYDPDEPDALDYSRTP